MRLSPPSRPFRGYRSLKRNSPGSGFSEPRRNRFCTVVWCQSPPRAVRDAACVQNRRDHSHLSDARISV